MPAPLIRPGHKYIRREGGPGHYRYFYYDPSVRGSRREATGEEDQALARVDHVRRLLAAAVQRGDALNAGTLGQIAREVGVTPTSVRWELSNMRARGRRAAARQAAPVSEPASLGHSYEERHLTEAGLGVGTQAYEAVANQKLRAAAEETVHARARAARHARGQPEVTSPAPQVAAAVDPMSPQVGSRLSLLMPSGDEQIWRITDQGGSMADAWFELQNVAEPGMQGHIPVSDLLERLARPADRALRYRVVQQMAGLDAPVREAADRELVAATELANRQRRGEPLRPPHVAGRETVGLSGLRVGTRVMLTTGQGRAIWQVLNLPTPGDDREEYRFGLVAGVSATDETTMRLPAQVVYDALHASEGQEGRMRVAYQESGHASAELDQNFRDELEAGAAPADPTKEVTLGTRLTFGTGEGMRLYEVAQVTPGAQGGSFLLRDITGRSPDTGITRVGLRQALAMAEDAPGRIRLAYQARPSGTEAPPTQQTAEARARVAAAAQPPKPPTAAQLVERLSRRGVDLDLLNLPEAEIEAALGPETPKEREYRHRHVLRQRGFDLDALNLPVADPAG